MSLVKPHEDNRMVRLDQEQKTKYGKVRMEESKGTQQEEALMER